MSNSEDVFCKLFCDLFQRNWRCHAKEVGNPFSDWALKNIRVAATRDKTLTFWASVRRVLGECREKTSDLLIELT
jgi:hypothetical protein